MLATFYLISYNQEEYIEAACTSALAQKYSPLEIIIVDDNSTDKTFEIAKKTIEKYQGPHKVMIKKNPINLGLIGQINQSFHIASGQLIIIAAGDDISISSRTAMIVDAFEKSNKQALIIHSNATIINKFDVEVGIMRPTINPLNWNPVELANKFSLYIGATGAWNKDLIKYFGKIKYPNAYEDLVFGFRAALTKNAIHIDKELVRYRAGIGISTYTSWINPVKKIKSEKKLIAVHIDVLRQRLEDINLAKSLENSFDIKMAIEQEINNQKRLQAIAKNPVIFYLVLLNIKIASTIKRIIAIRH